MPQNSKNETRNGQQVSPEALAAFYRHRSESLRNNHTTIKAQNEAMNLEKPIVDNNMRPSTGIVEYVISALQGHPGYMPK